MYVLGKVLLTPLVNQNSIILEKVLNWGINGSFKIFLYNLLNLEDEIPFKGGRSVTLRKFKPNFSGVF